MKMNNFNQKKRICLVLLVVLFTIQVTMSGIMLSMAHAAMKKASKGASTGALPIMACENVRSVSDDSAVLLPHTVSGNEFGDRAHHIMVKEPEYIVISDNDVDNNDVSGNGTQNAHSRDGAAMGSYVEAKNIVKRVEFEKVNRINGYCEAVKILLRVSDNFVARSDGNFAFSMGRNFINTSGIDYSDNREMTVSDNGTLYLCVRDDNNDRVVMEIGIDGIDDEAPIIGEVRAVDTQFKNGYAKVISLEVEATDFGCGIADDGFAIAGPFDGEAEYKNKLKWQSKRLFTVSQNGTYYFAVKDVYGNQTAIRTVLSSIDHEGPEVADVLYKIEGERNGYGKSVMVTAVIKDKAGLCGAPYSFDDGVSFTSISSNRFYDNCKAKLVFRDALFNETRKELAIDCIDREAPAVIVSENKTDMVRGFVKQLPISLIASDDKSGLHDKPYSDNRIDYYSNKNFVITQNGSYQYFVRDALGNEAAVRHEVACIDNDAPVIKDTRVITDGEKNGFGRTGHFIIDASDKGVGLADRAYSFDDGITYVSSNSVSVNKGGIMVVRVRDFLKNECRLVTEVKSIDSTGPEMIITGNPSSTVNTDVVLTIALSDSQSGLASLWYHNNSVKTKSLISSFTGNKDAKKKVTITKNGTYNFYAYDELGNESMTKIIVSKIDRDYQKPSDSTTSSSSSKTYTDYTNSTETKKSIVIGESKRDSSSSESVVAREIVIPEEYEDEEYTEEEESAEISSDDGGYVYAKLSENAIGDDEQLEREHYEGVYDEALSSAKETETIIEYPKVKKENDQRGTMVPLIASLIIIGLMLLVIFILLKLGIVKMPERTGMLERESKDLDIQDEE